VILVHPREDGRPYEQTAVDVRQKNLTFRAAPAAGDRWVAISGKGFDGRGNYNMGVKEQIIFPEIEYDKIDKTRGMDITIVTTAKTDQEGAALIRALGMPLV